MSDVQKFDFKRCWLDLSPAEREEFASDAGTTSHYIQVHLMAVEEFHVSLC